MMMDELPDAGVWDEVLGRINTTADKRSISLTCKLFYELNNEHRKSIRVGWDMNPANEGLLSLCKKLRNLQKVEISYTGFKPELGQQLDDVGLYNLSISCPLLADLTFRSCIDITDTGLSHLASCSNLFALKFIVAPSITGCGMSAVVAGCRKLASIHLNRCSNIVGLDWLGGVEKLEDLCIRHCRAIEEGDLIKLGPSWQTVKRLEFEPHAVFEHKSFDRWPSIPACDNMLELILIRSPFLRGGLSSILSKCHNLEKFHLDMSLGVEDSDIIALARNSTNLRAISFEHHSDFYINVIAENRTRLTDESLKALAQNCPHIESVRISSSSLFPEFSSFSIHGIRALVHKCPIRELSLERVHSFDDAGMRALCGAESLEMLELINCKGIRDAGIQIAAAVPRLRVLKLMSCYGLSNKAFKPLRRQRKLKLLTVYDCSNISEPGVKGAADSVYLENRIIIS